MLLQASYRSKSIYSAGRDVWDALYVLRKYFINYGKAKAEYVLVWGDWPP